MTITKPFRRSCRQFVDGDYLQHGNRGFVDDPRFAKAPEQYVRALLVIQKDLREIFDYVEPTDKNLECYSYRIHELLMRSCIEVEANCKAILSENGYSGARNIKDYCKLNATHRLSSFQVKIPLWHGDQAVRTPFSSWATGNASPTWYRAYNEAKHDRHKQFETANFRNLLDAVAGLMALLSSQFCDRDFEGPHIPVFVDDTYEGDGFETAIGKFFRIKYPDDWPQDQRYDFEWEKIKNDPAPFQSLF